MTDYVKIKDVLADGKEDDEIALRGWIYRTRSSGSIAFIILRDATGIIQTPVFKDTVTEEEFEEAKKALVETSVDIRGKVHLDERAPGGCEIHVTEFNVVSAADVFPIQKDQSEDHLLNNRHLWIRSRKLVNVMKVKESLLRGARDWFRENDFWEVTPPIITTNACEGGTTLFEIDYFGGPAYLSQSAQLYLEAMSFGLEFVYSLTPSFRAEKSKTRRHLIEYWHLEGEEAWVDNKGNMDIQEGLVSAMIGLAVEERGAELEELGGDLDMLKGIQPPFERITYERALEILGEKGVRCGWGMDLGVKEERALTEELEKPIFVTHFPVETKPFYMKMSSDERTYECADLLAPKGFGEVIGGSERETDYQALVDRLKNWDIPMENYEWYLDLRKYGSVPHSGFGLGLERLVMFVCNLDHIRDSQPFPRTINRAYP